MYVYVLHSIYDTISRQWYKDMKSTNIVLLTFKE